MDTKLISLILNIVFVLVLVIGFLSGLKGAKKSGLSLAFFVVGAILAFALTPTISKLVLNIQINVQNDQGEIVKQTINDFLASLINQSGLFSDIASSGSSTEKLIQALPQMFAKIVVFMALIIICSLVFKIIGAIVGAILFRNKKAKNPISKNTPSYVSATGNVRYVREEKPKKHRLAGGFLGLVHAFMFAVLLFVPVCALSGTITTLAYQTESSSQTSAVKVVYADDNSTNYTAFAKKLQEIIPAEVLDILNSINSSAVSKVVNVCDVNGVIFDNIAKCKVDGEKIELTAEISSVASVYNNMEYITTLDLSTLNGIKQLDFNSLRTAINSLFDSKMVKTVLTEVTTKALDWLTADDITGLSQQTQDAIKSIRDTMAENEYLHDFVYRLKKEYLALDNNARYDFLKNEVTTCLNLTESVVSMQYFQATFDNTSAESASMELLIDDLSQNNNALLNKLVSYVFDSKVAQIAMLCGTNAMIDQAKTYFDEKLAENAVEIAKINVLESTTWYDKTLVNDIFVKMLNIYNSIYTNYKPLGFDNISNDIRLLTSTENLEQILKTNIINFGIVLDDIKNLQILTQYGTLGNILSNIKQLELTREANDDGTETIYYVKDVINIELLAKADFSAETDFEQLCPAILKVASLSFQIDDAENGTTDCDIIRYIDQVGVKNAILDIPTDDLNIILNSLAQSQLLAPLNVLMINIINQEVKNAIGDQLGGDIIDLVPENVNVAEQAEDITNVVSDIKTLMPALEDISSGSKTLDEVLKDTSSESLQETSQTIVSLLNNLQTNANTYQEDGVFTGVYNAMLNYVKDESSGLTDIATIIEQNTVTDQQTDISTIDWQAVIDSYLSNSKS